MSHVGNVGARIAFAAPEDTKSTESATPPESTTENAEVAKKYPAGRVDVERAGLKLGTQITGGVLGLGGAALLGISLLSRSAPGAGASRLLAAPLLIGGGLVAAGAGAAIGAELLPSKQVVAAATNIPTRAEAIEVSKTFTDRKTSIVETLDGTFAVIDNGPYSYGTGRSSSGGGYYGGGFGHSHGGHYHDHYHYSGDNHYHQGGYSGPWYPDVHDRYPDPSYPSPGSYPTSPGDDFGYDYEPYRPPSSGGGTSRGDDSGWGSGGSSGGRSGGSTSRGDDDGGGSSYDPPSYNPPPRNDPPPAYNPPSYDPPAYDPPSYDYGGGNSSSNGNPSYDDF